MKRMIVGILLLSMLLSLAVVGVSAGISADVNDAAWTSAELKPILVQSRGDVYSELDEDYLAYWWEGEIPETGGLSQACDINMRGFAMSADGRYYYMGTLNGGLGVRGVVVYDNQACKVTDLYYHYDGEPGDPANPFSYAKGIAADDRGYVYTGFAFSKNYNVVNLGIAKQQDDGTLEEVSFTAVFEFGDPGDTGGIKVGVNGVDVAKVGDKYYCYFVANYQHDALYCYDVTDPANPKLNKDFGDNGVIEFSATSNTVKPDAGFEVVDTYYLDVDEDGTVWLITDGPEHVVVMKIAPDGSSCVESIPADVFYCVEHAGGYLLLGDAKGEFIEVRDDTSYEVIARVAVPAHYGDRITRIQIVHDVMFVCDAGNDNNWLNAVHAAPLSVAGQEFFDRLVANMSQSGGDETTEEKTEAPTDEAVTDAPETAAPETQAPDTEAPTDAPVTDAPEETEAPKEGCGATVALAAVAVMTAAAAFVARKKD